MTAAPVHQDMVATALALALALFAAVPGGPSDAEIFRRMGVGRYPDPFGDAGTFPDRLPAEYGDLPGAAGARAVAEANRTAAHRERYGPVRSEVEVTFCPDECELLVSACTAGCGEGHDSHYVLRLSDGRARLLFARSLERGWPGRGSARHGRDRDLGATSVPIAKARRLVQAVLAVPHLRVDGPFPRKEDRGTSSYWTVDIELRWGSQSLFRTSGRVDGSISRTFRSELDDTVRRRLAIFLFAEAFLGRVAPELSPYASLRHRPPPQLMAGAVAILDAADEDPDSVSPALLCAAVEAAGDLRATVLADRVEELAARNDLDESVRAAARKALGQIAVADDPARLLSIARADDPLSLWVAGRLAVVSPERYRELLAAWVRIGQRRGSEALGILAKIAPANAIEVARSVPLDRRPELAPAVFDAFRRFGDPEELRRVADRLAAIARDPGLDAWFRAEAIGRLVPDDDPGLFPDVWVDRLLAELLAEPSRGWTDSVRTATVFAMDRRGRPGCVLRLLAAIERGEEPLVSTIEVAARLVALAGGEYRAELALVLRRQLEGATPNLVEPIVRAAFVADLRDLAPRIEKFATTNPGEEANGSRSHLARQVLALWREPDPVTRAKLLTAFAFANAWRVLGPESAAVRRRLVGLLADAARAFDDAGGREALRFLDVCRHRDWPRAWGPEDQAWRGRLVAIIRRALGR